MRISSRWRHPGKRAAPEREPDSPANATGLAPVLRPRRNRDDGKLFLGMGVKGGEFVAQGRTCAPSPRRKSVLPKLISILAVMVVSLCASVATGRGFGAALAGLVLFAPFATTFFRALVCLADLGTTGFGTTDLTCGAAGLVDFVLFFMA